MHTRSWRFKFFVVLFLLINAVIFTGVESAFCDDGVQESSSHHCITCHSGHSTAVLNQSLSISPILPETIFQLEQFVFRAPAPSINLLRPPILA